MTQAYLRILLAASAALQLWHLLAISQIFRLVQEGYLNVFTFGIPLFATPVLLTAVAMAKRFPKTARLLFVLAGGMGLAAVSILIAFWERYVPLPILALAGLVVTEIHHIQSHVKDES
jgi:hypothetical protein